MADTWEVEHFENPAAAERGKDDTYPFHDIVSLDGYEKAKSHLETFDDFCASPLIEASDLAESCGVASVLIKDESDRLGLGSFKGLGGSLAVASVAAAAKASAPNAAPRIVTASAGNHGIGVASGAARAGVECTVYLHEGVTEAQAERIRSYGAKVMRTEGTSYEHSLEVCASDAASNENWHIVQDVSWEGYVDVPKQIWAGYSVVAGEMIDQLEERDEPMPTHVFVNTGVGGFANAMCGHLWERLGHRRPRFVTVEPTAASCHLASARAGRPVAAGVGESTVQVGLDCKEVDPLTFEMLSRGADHFVAVPDSVVRPSIDVLRESTGIVGGDSSVAGLAVILAAAKNPELRSALGIGRDSRVAVVICETAFS